MGIERTVTYKNKTIKDYVINRQSFISIHTLCHISLAWLVTIMITGKCLSIYEK